MAETTETLPGTYRLEGSYEAYEVQVARHAYEHAVLYTPLTPCCGATGKGSTGATVCRACYAEVDDVFGACWVGEAEFASHGPRPVAVARTCYYTGRGPCGDCRTPEGEPLNCFGPADAGAETLVTAAEHAEQWETDHPDGVISPEERASMDAYAAEQHSSQGRDHPLFPVWQQVSITWAREACD